MNSTPEEKVEGSRKKDEVIIGAAPITPALRERWLQTKERARQLPAPRSLLAALFLCATLGFLWFVLCRDLSLEWSSNEQYSYGWFVPFFAAFLFWLRVEDFGKAESGQLKAETGMSAGSTREPLTIFRFPLSAFSFLLLLFPVRLFEVANPDWRPLSWIHALIVVGFTLLVIGNISRPAGRNAGEAEAGLSSPSVKSIWKPGFRAVRHFAFPVCFILVAVPWLTPIEAPIVQGLMRLAAAVATETLTLFGIPAQLEGSLIRVNNGIVGVSEACSGVRSLQTSLMIGLLFGELKRLTIARRVALVGVALAIALLANFGRAIFLVWIAATQSLAAVERWHDIAGYAIVGAVVVGTVAIASAMAKGRSKKDEGRSDSGKEEVGRKTEDASEQSPLHRSSFILHPSLPFFLLTFAFFLLTEVSVSAWYHWHERNLVPSVAWEVTWPESAPRFQEVPVDEHTREMLRYDEGREASWAVADVVRPADFRAEVNSPERTGRAILFFFRWEPGTATVLRARAHRPDICLPAVGWRQSGSPTLRSYRVNDKLALAFEQFSFVHNDPGGRPLYAQTFFSLHEDRVAPGAASRTDVIPFSHWSIPERWAAVRHGLRNPGQQVLEFVLLSHAPLSAEEAESGFSRIVPRVVKQK